MCISKNIELPFDSVFSLENVIGQHKINDKESLSITDGLSTLVSSDNDFFSQIIPLHLSKNELKLISEPFGDEIVFFSEKFKEDYEANLSENQNFEINITPEETYILGCILIIKKYFKIDFSFEKKIILEFISRENINSSFLVDLNHDFVKILPKKSTKIPVEKDIYELLENANDIEKWKSVFPQSWVAEGFTIITLFENTMQHAISNLKSILINDSLKPDIANYELKKHFRSIFNVDDLKIGLTMYDEDENIVFSPQINLYNIESSLLNKKSFENIDVLKNDSLFKQLFNDREVLVVDNFEAFCNENSNSQLLNSFKEKSIGSFIISPIVNNTKLLGFFEIMSSKENVLTAKSLRALNLILPIIISTIERNAENFQNKIDAIIQNQFTRLHPSVNWKFKRQVVQFLNSTNEMAEFDFNDIVFEKVHALFGEIDIKSSTNNRLIASKNDISKQLELLIEIISEIYSEKSILLLEQVNFQLKSFITEMENELEAGLELRIKHYLEDEVHPILERDYENESIRKKIISYFESLDNDLETIYEERKNYDESVKILNKKLEILFDKKQVEAQAIFPHYFERYATDGVEHNIYIGQSIHPKQKFEMLYLHNLRLWQIKTMCDALYNYHKWKSILPFELELTSLILVFSLPLTIKFRMDEKLFDVDGAYNARYEVVKKRIDKACIKGTEERLTQPNTLAIVFSHEDEIHEYKNYINFLIADKILEDKIEELELEDLQSVSGLKAIRVTIAKI